MTRISLIYLKGFFEHFVQVFIVTLLIPLIIHLNGLWNERQWCNIVGNNGKIKIIRQEIRLADCYIFFATT